MRRPRPDESTSRARTVWLVVLTTIVIPAAISILWGLFGS